MMNILIALIAFQPLQVEETILDNGLKVLIYEDHFAPVVSVQVHYRVGAYNEVLGITGISHLLEHMAFKGTTKIGPKEYNKIIERAGGEENAFTSTHRTVYFANLSEDRYEIELELEADRMKKFPGMMYTIIIANSIIRRTQLLSLPEVLTRLTH